MHAPDSAERVSGTTIIPDPEAAGLATGATIAFLAAPEGVEQSELTAPWKAVADAGAVPRLISTRPGQIQAFEHLDAADSFTVDDVLDGLDVTEFDALVLPGGVANPDYLRTQPAAVALVRDFVERGLPVAAICHAPWLLIEADAVNGRDLTSYPSLRTDLVNAGAHWVDERAVVCHNGPNTLITSRRPDDLPAFCANLVDVVRREYTSV